MAAIPTTRQVLADAWKGIASGTAYVGLCTGNPGSTSTPANEVSGGSPAYARASCVLTSGTGGVVTGAATSVNCPATTVTWALVATASTGNNAFDYTSITSTTLVANAPIIVTPGCTVS